jgi:hypothetical protein
VGVGLTLSDSLLPGTERPNRWLKCCTVYDKNYKVRPLCLLAAGCTSYFGSVDQNRAQKDSFQAQQTCRK